MADYRINDPGSISKYGYKESEYTKLKSGEIVLKSGVKARGGVTEVKLATVYGPNGAKEVVTSGSPYAANKLKAGWSTSPSAASTTKAIINANQPGDIATKTDNPPSIYDTAIEKTSQAFFENIGQRPVAPSMADTYKGLLGEKTDTNPEGLGITVLESQLSDLQNQEAAIQKTNRERLQAEEDKPVALGVIGGRQSEIDRQTQKQLSDIAIQKTAVTNVLNMKYNMVNTMMSLKKMDYENASADYDSKFNQAISAINLLRGLKSDEQNDKDRAETSARANLQIIYNGIEKGAVDFSKLDPNVKNSITKWETQAGLPAGFVQTIKSTNPTSEIVSTTSRVDGAGKKYIDLVMRNQDGSISVKSAYVGQEKISSSGSGSGGGGTSYEMSKNDVGGLSFEDSKGNAVTAGQYAASKKQNLISVLQKSGDAGDKQVIANIQSGIDDIKAKRVTVAEAYRIAQQTWPWIFDGVSQSQFKQILGI